MGREISFYSIIVWGHGLFSVWWARDGAVFGKTTIEYLESVAKQRSRFWFTMMSSCWQLVAISDVLEGSGSLVVLYFLFYISNVIPVFSVCRSPGDVYFLWVVFHTWLSSRLSSLSLLFLLSAMMSSSCVSISLPRFFFFPFFSPCRSQSVLLLSLWLSSTRCWAPAFKTRHISDKCRWRSAWTSYIWTKGT